MLVSLMRELILCGDMILGVRTISREYKALLAECEVTPPHLDYDAKGGRFDLTYSLVYKV